MYLLILISALACMLLKSTDMKATVNKTICIKVFQAKILIPKKL